MRISCLDLWCAGLLEIPAISHGCLVNNDFKLPLPELYTSGSQTSRQAVLILGHVTVMPHCWTCAMFSAVWAGNSTERIKYLVQLQVAACMLAPDPT